MAPRRGPRKPDAPSSAIERAKRRSPRLFRDDRRRALEKAEREDLSVRLRRLREFEQFEERLQILRDVPGWHYVRQGRRALLTHFVQPQERVAAYLLLHQKALLYEVQIKRRRARRSGRIALGLHWFLYAIPFAVLWSLVWVQERIYLAITRGQRLMLRGVVSIPHHGEAVLTASREELATPRGRAGLRRAMIDEEHLTPRRRRALVFLSLTGLVVVWLVAEILVQTAFRYALDEKRAFDWLFYYGAATRLILPTPLEFAIFCGEDTFGIGPSIVIAGLGAMVGSWIYFFIGSVANRQIGKLVRRRPWGERFWTWFRQNARRYGYVAMAVLLAIPFAPDNPVTAIFSLLGLRLRWFLVAVLAGTTARLTIFLLLWDGPRFCP